MSAVSFEIDWEGVVVLDERGEKWEHGWRTQPVLPPTEALTTVGITSDDDDGYMLRFTTFHVGDRYHIGIELPLDKDKVESLLEFLHFIRQRMA